MNDHKMSKSEVGRLGGLARQSKYGNPGTSEGRRLGGLRSQITHRTNKTGFNTLKKVHLPRYSVALAELFGILAGDGHVGEYQVSMTTNARTDAQHAYYVQKLFLKLFHISSNISKRKTSNALVVVLSSKKVCDFLCVHGLVRGNKVQMQLDAPLWVRGNEKYRTVFLRGLFDTDGSVYVDVHKINGVTYHNIGMAFTNRSTPLLLFFKTTLELLGFHPTQKTKYIVFLRREAEVRRYFDLIGSSNQKHLDRLRRYIKRKEEYRRGRNGPHSKCG